MKYLLLLTFLFCSKSGYSKSAPKTSESSVVNSTTPVIGKCDNIVSELVIQLEADNGSQNTTALCRKVSECYGSIEGETAKKLKKIYDFRCEKYELYSVDMMYCFKRILEERDWGSREECTKMLSLTTTNLKQKRELFSKDKSCLLNVTKKVCSVESFNYLNTNYDHFVNFLTTAPENDSCESLHAELNNKQCEVNKEAEVNLWWFLADYEIEYGKFAYVNECHKDPCNIISTVKEMKDYEFYNATLSKFYDCLYSHGSLHPVAMGNCTASDKECTKKAMIETCGTEYVKEFDKYFDWFNKYDLTNVRKLRIHGDFSKYEVTDTFKNSFSFGSELGKCAPLVENLVTLLSRKSMDGEQKYYRIATEKCLEIDECFGSINSDEAQKQGKKYQSVCDKLKLRMDRWKTKDNNHSFV